jgi:hypothetical protein
LADANREGARLVLEALANLPNTAPAPVRNALWQQDRDLNRQMTTILAPGSEPEDEVADQAPNRRQPCSPRLLVFA